MAMKDGIVKRGNRWAFVVELPRDPATGRRRQKWFSGYATRREAVAAREQVRADLRSETYVERSRQSVHAFLDDWLAAIEPTIRPATMESYERYLRLHVRPRIGAVLLPDLDPVIINKMYAELLRSGRRDGNGGLKPRTVRYIHTILRRALRDAVRWGRLARNPVDLADPPGSAQAAAPEMATWDAATLGRFLELSRSSEDFYYPAWHFLATTALRRGEVLGLRWSDLSNDNRRVSIRQTLVCVSHRIEFSTPKTAKGRRAVVLDENTTDMLIGHRHGQAEAHRLLGVSSTEDLVFCLRDGRPIHPERFSREFDRRIQRWGLPRIRLHDLRHTWATLALEAGIHPKVVSERLGHANIGITLDTYSHVTRSMQEEAADRVAETIVRSNTGAEPYRRV
ncbi:MAG: tyrosine-type recombinase/integrase [Actinomycetota bacterium]